MNSITHIIVMYGRKPIIIQCVRSDFYFFSWGHVTWQVAENWLCANCKRSLRISTLGNFGCLFVWTLSINKGSKGHGTFGLGWEYQGTLCPKCSANPNTVTPIWKWGFENKVHLIRGLCRTFFEKFLFRFPFSHERFQMGQKMYFYQLYKL